MIGNILGECLGKGIAKAAMNSTQKAAANIGSKLAISTISCFAGTKIKNDIIKKEALELSKNPSLDEEMVNKRLNVATAKGSAAYGASIAGGAGVSVVLESIIKGL